MLLALVVGVLTVVHLAAWPILVQDTDIWYHLNSGRYLWTHLALPHDSFFSFVNPPRPLVDYYWLFQATVYGLFSQFGYYGLIALRAALLLYFAATGNHHRLLAAHWHSTVERQHHFWISESGYPAQRSKGGGTGEARSGEHERSRVPRFADPTQVYERNGGKQITPPNGECGASP